MICDSGVRYLDTCYNDAWLATNGFDVAPYRQQLTRFQETGRWPALAAAAAWRGSASGHDRDHGHDLAR